MAPGGDSSLEALRSTHNDAKLDIHEVEALLRESSPEITQKEIVGIFKGVDKTGCGFVNFGDLVDFIFAESASPPVVVASPALEGLAGQLRSIFGIESDPIVDWELFKSGDSNIRYHWKAISGQRVIFLFDSIDQSRLLEQLSLLQALQGFPVPDGEDAKNKWKNYVSTGKYYWGRAAEVIVVIPWFRPCQMERTSKWDKTEEGKWTNANPEGSWLDVPTAQTYARLLASPGLPLPGPTPIGALDGKSIDPLWRPPMKLLFIDLHEEEPVQIAAADLGVTVQMRRMVPWFLAKFRAGPTFTKEEDTYVLFPDHGAYDRYLSYVMELMKLKKDHVLWINKKRVGDSITQERKLHFQTDAGEEGEKSSFVEQDHVLVMDDFTNSGSTLFGAVGLVRSLAGEAGSSMKSTIFVSHTVASYSDDGVQGILSKLAELGPTCTYCTTDSVYKSAAILEGKPQVEIFHIAEFLAELVR